MPRCPQCNKDIPVNVMTNGTVKNGWDYYLFKCNHCGTDLEIPKIWKAILWMVLWVPIITYLFFTMNVIWAKVLLLFLMIIFYAILVRLLKIKGKEI